MRHKRLIAIGTVLTLSALPAFAEEWPSTFDAALQAVIAKNCKRTEHPDYLLFNCAEEPAIYVFTKPNTPAYPGVIKRHITSENGESYMDTDAHSWGDDAAQPAFQSWMRKMGLNPPPIR